MSKIVIVGHPASGYREVETVLRQCGMGEALPSRRDALSPQQITATLCKVHKTPPLDAVTDEEEIRQIEAGSVWHGMALDLMLGNLDQPLWGWADPQAIHTLDYWSGLDPQMIFVLVFDEPHRLLMEAARTEAGNPPADSLRHMLDNWAAYNGALLRFHLRHPGRCLLVHARQTQQAAEHYLQQLQDLLDAPLTLPCTTPDHAPQLIADTEHSVAATSTITTVLAQIAKVDRLKPEHIPAVVNATATERYLADGVLADYPKALQLYAELQSAANLPLDKAARAAASAASAWETWIRQRAFVFDLVSNIHAEYRSASDALTAAHQQIEGKSTALIDLQRQIEYKQTESKQQNERLSSQLHQTQEDLKHHQTESQRLKKQVEEKNTALTEVRQQAEQQQTESSQENELLLSQMHLAQEELERYHIENQRLKKQVEDQNTTLAQARQKVEQKQTEISQKNQLLQSQLHKAQEDLKRQHTEDQHLKKQVEEKSAALTKASQQAEQQQTESSNENEMLLSQLHLVQEELERYYIDNQHIKKQAEQKQTEDEQLQSRLQKIQEELKHRHAESQSLKKQVENQRAALADTGHENERLLLQLNRVQQELERYHLENQRLKRQISPPKPPGPVGAADRVKKQLSYRLGAVMINRSHTLGGWLTMPWALMAEARAFRKDHQANGDIKLPPIHTYRDALEADRIKQHLSYRIGTVLLKHAKSPVGWFTMPFAVKREWHEFKQQRQKIPG